MIIKHIEWGGTIASILGAFIVAFGFMLIGYSFFLIGSISWLYVGIKQQNRPLIILNFTFFFANIIGFARNVV